MTGLKDMHGKPLAVGDTAKLPIDVTKHYTPADGMTLTIRARGGGETVVTDGPGIPVHLACHLEKVNA